VHFVARCMSPPASLLNGGTSPVKTSLNQPAISSYFISDLFSADFVTTYFPVTGDIERREKPLQQQAECLNPPHIKSILWFHPNITWLQEITTGVLRRWLVKIPLTRVYFRPPKRPFQFKHGRIEIS
jgi:hypothetical protein